MNCLVEGIGLYGVTIPILPQTCNPSSPLICQQPWTYLANPPVARRSFQSMEWLQHFQRLNHCWFQTDEYCWYSITHMDRDWSVPLAVRTRRPCNVPMYHALRYWGWSDEQTGSDRQANPISNRSAIPIINITTTRAERGRQSWAAAGLGAVYVYIRYNSCINVSMTVFLIPNLFCYLCVVLSQRTENLCSKYYFLAKLYH